MVIGMVALVLLVVPGIQQRIRRAELLAIVSALQMLPWEKRSSALEGFRRDMTGEGKPVPATVTAEELLRRGHLRSNELAGLPLSTRFVLDPEETDEAPQFLLAYVRVREDLFCGCLADGSIQQFDLARLGEQLRLRPGRSASTNDSPHHAQPRNK